MGAGFAPVQAAQTCVFHEERTQQLAELGACVRTVEARLGEMASRLAVGNEVLSVIQRDLDGAHQSLREQRTQVSDQFAALSERIERIAEAGQITRRNAERLDCLERTLEKVDSRLQEIEVIAARRVGIEDKVAHLESFAAEVRASLRAIKAMFGVLLALFPMAAAVVGWLIMHGPVK